MPTKAHLAVDDVAADLVRDAKRHYSALEQEDVTLSGAIKRLVAAVFGEGFGNRAAEVGQPGDGRAARDGG